MVDENFISLTPSPLFIVTSQFLVKSAHFHSYNDVNDQNYLMIYEFHGSLFEIFLAFDSVVLAIP